ELSHYSAQGVRALASSTPSESAVTGGSWSYEITKRRNVYSISWLNNYGVNGVPIVILLQYGHTTGTGEYVRSRDFIHPAIRPILDQIDESVWKAVTSAEAALTIVLSIWNSTRVSSCLASRTPLVLWTDLRSRSS